jgi:hypothetical protein
MSDEGFYVPPFSTFGYKPFGMEEELDYYTEKAAAQDAICEQLESELENALQRRDALLRIGRQGDSRAIDELAASLKWIGKQIDAHHAERTKAHLRQRLILERIADYRSATEVAVDVLLADGSRSVITVNPSDSASTLLTYFDGNAVDLNGTSINRETGKTPIYGLFTLEGPQIIFVHQAPKRSRSTNLTIDVEVLNGFKGRVDVDGRLPLRTLKEQVEHAISTPPLANSFLDSSRRLVPPSDESIEDFFGRVGDYAVYFFKKK